MVAAQLVSAQNARQMPTDDWARAREMAAAVLHQRQRVNAEEYHERLEVLQVPAGIRQRYAMNSGCRMKTRASAEAAVFVLGARRLEATVRLNAAE